MTRGKEICKILKEIRRQIAEANGLEFTTSECRYKGDCLGTCPKCESEVRYLEQQLRARSLAGRAIVLAGISAASLAMLMPMTSEAQTPIDITTLSSDSIAMTRDESSKVKGTVKHASTADADSIVTEDLIGATVVNLTQRKATATDIDGKFEIEAEVGDTIEVSYVGFKSKTVTVTDISQPITVTLDMQAALLGEIPVVTRDMTHCLDIEDADLEGYIVGCDSISIE